MRESMGLMKSDNLGVKARPRKTELELHGPMSFSRKGSTALTAKPAHPDGAGAARRASKRQRLVSGLVGQRSVCWDGVGLLPPASTEEEAGGAAKWAADLTDSPETPVYATTAETVH
jgi:hypothetical protein